MKIDSSSDSPVRRPLPVGVDRGRAARDTVDEKLQLAVTGSYMLAGELTGLAISV